VSPEIYRSRIADAERYVNGMSMVGCPGKPGCRDGFWPHAEALVCYLTTCIEADYWGEPRPPIESGVAHLDVIIARELALAERRWSRPSGLYECPGCLRGVH
jgi:hypothetical protein